MEKLAKKFKALSDETRLKVLLLVSKRDICQKGISKYLGITDSSVSQPQAVLPNTGTKADRATGALGALSLLGAFGLLFAKKKKDDEEETRNN